MPVGVSFCGSFDEAIFAEMHWSFGWGNRVDDGRLSFDLSRWPITKANLYRGVWEEGEFGMTNPLKLGQSTTSFENLKDNHRRLRHGRLLVILSLDSDRLIQEGGVNFGIDREHTFLFDATPEEIVSVYDAGGIKDEEVWRLAANRLTDYFVKKARQLA